MSLSPVTWKLWELIGPIRTQMTTIFEGQPPQNMTFSSKKQVSFGFEVYLYVNSTSNLTLELWGVFCEGDPLAL